MRQLWAEMQRDAGIGESYVQSPTAAAQKRKVPS